MKIRAARRLPRSNVVRIAVSLLFMAGVVAASLVARAELHRDRRRVHDREMGVGRVRDRSQPRVRRRARAGVAHGDQPGDRRRRIPATCSSSRPSRSGSSRTPCFLAGSASSRASPCSRASCRSVAAPGRRSSARSSRIACSTSCPCSPHPLCRPHREDPRLGDHEPPRLRRRRRRALHVRVRERAAPEHARARRRRRGAPDRRRWHGRASA